jgi:hypothetical protein
MMGGRQVDDFMRLGEDPDIGADLPDLLKPCRAAFFPELLGLGRSMFEVAMRMFTRD